MILHRLDLINYVFFVAECYINCLQLVSLFYLIQHLAINRPTKKNNLTMVTFCFDLKNVYKLGHTNISLSIETPLNDTKRLFNTVLPVWYGIDRIFKKLHIFHNATPSDPSKLVTFPSKCVSG